ncbi:MAG: hypothetical protein ABIQ24_03665 [Nitrospiraceae bacterium]
MEEMESRRGTRRSYVVRTTSQGVDVVKVDPQWTWQKEPVLRIAECVALKENWDSYGGHPPSFDTVLAAIDLIDAIPQHDPPRPRVVPLATGGIQLEWKVSQRELDIEISPGSTYRYLKFDPRITSGELDNELPLDSLSDVEDLLSWLITG